MSWWVTRDKEVLLIRDMTDSHLVNAIKLLLRNDRLDPYGWGLIDEIRERGYCDSVYDPDALDRFLSEKNARVFRKQANPAKVSNIKKENAEQKRKREKDRKKRIEQQRAQTAIPLDRFSMLEFDD